MQAMKFGVGQAVKRVEDVRFVTGQGRYISDIELPGALHVAFLRSTHACATFSRPDCEAARALPGVHAVYVAQDFESHNAQLSSWLKQIETYPLGADPIDATRRLLQSRKLDQKTLGSLRATLEKHIKNTYLKSVQAPVGVKPVLRAWMELT